MLIESDEEDDDSQSSSGTSETQLYSRKDNEKQIVYKHEKTTVQETINRIVIKNEPEDVHYTDEKVINCRTKIKFMLLKSFSGGLKDSRLVIKSNEESRTITLRGPPEIVLEYSALFLERLNSVCVTWQPISERKYAIFQRQGCIEEFNTRTKDTYMDRTFHLYLEEDESSIDQKLHCAAFSNEDAKKALQKALEFFKKTEIMFSDHHLELFSSKAWNNITNGLQGSLMVAIEIVHSRTVVEVEGLDNHVTVATNKVRDVVNDHKPFLKQTIEGAKGRLFLKSASLQMELRRLKEEAIDNQGTLEVEQSGETMTIRFMEYGSLGNRIKDVIGQVKEMKLIASDVSKNADEQEVIARCLNTEKGKRELRTLEEKHGVTIDVIPCKEIKVKVIEDVSTSFSKSDVQQELDVEPLVVGSTELIVKKGSVVSERASTLVNVLPKSSLWKKAKLPRLFSSASRQIKQEFEGKYDGEQTMVVTAGKSGHLPSVCQLVCNIVLQDLDRGKERNNEQELREAIKACLVHCELRRQTSIAFPPVGTGKILKFPIAVVARVMLEECIAWSKKTKTLQKILFVIHDKDELLAFDRELNRYRETLSRGFRMKMFTMFRSTPRPSKPTEPEPRSVKSEVAYASDLLIYGESSEILKDSYRRISKELGELFLGKEIIELSRVGKLSGKEKEEIYEATKQMSVILKMNNDHCVIMGHKDDVQSLANKIRAMLLSSMSDTSHGSQRSGRRWMGPRSRKGTEEYWKEVLCNSTTPLYWKEFRGGHEIQHFLQTEENHCRVNPVDKETFKAISELVEQTWTGDVVGKGADARNLSHRQIRVTKIERVESIELFSHYSNERDGIIRRMLRSGLTSYPRLDTLTTKGGLLTTLKMPKLLNTSLYLDVNEHYAFHGTKSSYVENIVRKGIDPRRATDKLLFGQGIYCAESSTKADQYTDDKSKREKTDLKILLVRLLIGNPFVSGQSKNYKHPPCTTCKTTDCFNGEHVNYDSIIVEGTWMFREFVVYDSNHCYPEYIITYDRV